MRDQARAAGMVQGDEAQREALGRPGGGAACHAVPGERVPAAGEDAADLVPGVHPDGAGFVGLWLRAGDRRDLGLVPRGYRPARGAAAQLLRRHGFHGLVHGQDHAGGRGAARRRLQPVPGLSRGPRGLPPGQLQPQGVAAEHRRAGAGAGQPLRVAVELQCS